MYIRHDHFLLIARQYGVAWLWIRSRELKQQYDLKSHDAKLLSDSLKQSSHGQQLDEIEQLEATIGLSSTVNKYVLLLLK